MIQSQEYSVADVNAALYAAHPGEHEFAALVSPAAVELLEPMARRAQALTRGHFGKTISLYAPLYLSNYCPGGCAYCGFAADRNQPRHRLSMQELEREIAGLKSMQLEDILLLTGERCPQADFEYLRDCVELTAKHFHNVSVEAFAMSRDEYAMLADAGCTGVTLYQETYDRELYAQLHRWGDKRDYDFRIEAASNVLEAGMHYVGVGALLGLAEPMQEMQSLFRHAKQLQKKYWRSGIMVSFPRICHEVGDFSPEHIISDEQLVQYILAFRICLPDVPLVLSTRESKVLRDGMAGVGISRMSVASRTTVGGYGDSDAEDQGQFDVQDVRDVNQFCRDLKGLGLEPVFKNWDAVFWEKSEI
jgi:2-iminoacetate synthase